jgi:hypothetical protein
MAMSSLMILLSNGPDKTFNQMIPNSPVWFLEKMEEK